MFGLPYGEKTMTICSAVFIQYQRVTDGQNCYINIARQSIAIKMFEHLHSPQLILSPKFLLTNFYWFYSICLFCYRMKRFRLLLFTIFGRNPLRSPKAPRPHSRRPHSRRGGKYSSHFPPLLLKWYPTFLTRFSPWCCCTWSKFVRTSPQRCTVLVSCSHIGL